MPLQVAYTVLDLFFEPNPIMLDRRGQLAALSRGRPLYATTNIAPDSVQFDAPRRWLQIDIIHLLMFCGGHDDFEELLDFGMMVLQTASVTRLTATRLTRFFAIPSTEALSSLVAQHSASIAPTFDPRPVAGCVDVGTIFSIDFKGRLLNYQFGPMGRNQWKALGGAKMAAVEESLPAVAWGIGVYDREPIPRTIDLKGTKRMIVDTLGEWETLVEETVSKDA